MQMRIFAWPRFFYFLRYNTKLRDASYHFIIPFALNRL